MFYWMVLVLVKLGGYCSSLGRNKKVFERGSGSGNGVRYLCFLEYEFG